MTTETRKHTSPVQQPKVDPMHVTIIIETLTALSAHPDFQAGLRDAKVFFLESHEAAPLSEDEMMDEVETNLCRSVIEQCRKVARTYGYTTPSYIYNLGFVFGTINQGLTYSYQVCD